jgi:hypothetical protein
MENLTTIDEILNDKIQHNILNKMFERFEEEGVEQIKEELNEISRSVEPLWSVGSVCDLIKALDNSKGFSGDARQRSFLISLKKISETTHTLFISLLEGRTKQAKKIIADQLLDKLTNSQIPNNH